MRAVLIALVLAAAVSAQRAEPTLTSLHPFTVQRGTALTATVRGSGLKGARAVYPVHDAFQVTVEAVESEPAAPGRRGTVDAVRLRIEPRPDAAPGRYPLRLVTANGVSNALTLFLTEHPVLPEPDGSHDRPETAVPVSSPPSIFNGRIAARGEADFYRFQARAGETLTFEVHSGLPHIAAAGSGATIGNFDPSVTIYEAAGSWLDPSRLVRIAYSDEPLFLFGRITDAHVTHRFEREGSYLLRIEAFAGQGGPDYGYQLKILPGSAPQDLPQRAEGWEERGYTRALSPERLGQLASRGGAKDAKPSIETYRATPEGAPVKLPAILDGAFTEAREIHRARFEISAPADIAIEIETPAVAPPFFNPLVRLLDADGEEVATSVMAGLGACSGALTKSLQAKTIVPLRNLGTYTVEVRDAVAEAPSGSFRYRVMIRPQVPHLGGVRIDADRVNLAPDEARSIRVTFDREEDYRGGIAVVAEGLPSGVYAVTGADFEEERDDPQRAGRRERYTPRTERTVLVLTAAADAAPTPEPALVRLVARPVMGGKLGEPLASKTVPLMVLAKP